MYGYQAANPVSNAPDPWVGLQPRLSDDNLLPGLQDLLEVAGPGVAPPLGTSTALQDYSGLELPLLPPGYGIAAYESRSYAGPTTPALQSLPLEVPSAEDEARSTGIALPLDYAFNEDRKQGSVEPDDGTHSSPGGSSCSKGTQGTKAGDKSTATQMDKKTLAKMRYREKNRKAQARHRERNKRTIEDLTAKVSALTAENANLKLELSIQSTVSKAKDEHYSKLRRAKENLAYVEAESLLQDTYAYAAAVNATVPDDTLQWCLQDSASVREVAVQRMAGLLRDPNVRDASSRVYQDLHSEMMRKRQLSLRFAVGKPRFARSLLAWEREYCKHIDQPDFGELWRRAVRAMDFSQEQRLQIAQARAVLISKMRTILHERKSLVEAARAGAMEGVADVLASSLEEERQAVFGFLFTFFDETLSVLQECTCDVETYPWAPDVAAISDIVTEDAVAASPSGVEGLSLPAHLLPSRDGQADIDSLTQTTVAQLKPICQKDDVVQVARAAGTPWPQETPYELLVTPVTSRSCSTSGICLLRNVLMFAEGVMPVRLPDVPRDVLTRIPLLKMIRMQQ